METNSLSGPSRPPAAPPSQRGVKRTHIQMRDSSRSSSQRASTPLFVEQQPPRIHLPPLQPGIRTGRSEANSAGPQEGSPILARRALDLRRPATQSRTAFDIIDLTEGGEERSRSRSPPPAEASRINHAATRASTPRTPSVHPLLRGVVRSGRRLPASHMAADRPPPRLLREPSSDIVVVGESRVQGSAAQFVIHDLTQEPDIPEANVDQAATGHNNNHGDDDDDVVVTHTTRLAGVNNAPPAAPTNRDPQTAPVPPSGGLMRYIMERTPTVGMGMLAPMREFVRQFVHEPHPPLPVVPIPELTANPHPRRPGMPLPHMDYSHVGFTLGGIARFVPRGYRVPPPTEPELPLYVPPEAAPSGFTRSPAEDEEVVCPCCGDELGVGPTDSKRQVWVVKACGHVYCGHCMVNRNKTGRRGKGRVLENNGDPVPRAFSRCLIPYCGNKITGKATVLQVFL